MELRLHAMVLHNQLLAHGLCNKWADLDHMAHVVGHLGFLALFTLHYSYVNSTHGHPLPSPMHSGRHPFHSSGFVD